VHKYSYTNRRNIRESDMCLIFVYLYVLPSTNLCFVFHLSLREYHTSGNKSNSSMISSASLLICFISMPSSQWLPYARFFIVVTLKKAISDHKIDLFKELLSIRMCGVLYLLTHSKYFPFSLYPCKKAEFRILSFLWLEEIYGVYKYIWQIML
jgi:hypothetical protein